MAENTVQSGKPQLELVIFLTIKRNDSMGEKEWRCIKCGKIFYSTHNKIIYGIFEGEITELAASSEIRCWFCKTIYILE